MILVDDKCDITLDIAGLMFQRNNTGQLSEAEGWFSLKVSSSHGPLISDFVTHGADFEYSTYGIHVGQEDRLTFFGHGEKKIVGHFIDCREGSETVHKRVSCSFSPNPYRKLIIPRGVAHTFDGLSAIVTRDEPIWFSSDDNRHWNVNNDLISVLRNDLVCPVVKVNEYRLPDEIHAYMSRLSQAVLDKPKSYSTRFNLKIDGKEQYVMFQENTWDKEGRELQSILNAANGSAVSARPSKYAITGKASWTLVPNTGAGVSDVLYLPAQESLCKNHMFVHRRTKKHYTFLTNEGTLIEILTLDLRPSSPKFGQAHAFQTISDPRVSYVIEPGVAYRFSVAFSTYVRSENEVYLSEEEPRNDIPAIGQDLEVIDANDFSPNQPPLPTLRCPDYIIRRMAQFEIEPYDGLNN